MMAGGSYIRGDDGALREPPGHEALWNWFALSRAAWLVMPRSMMHEMPDDWQAKMAALLAEWDATYTNMPNVETVVTLRENGRMTKPPEYLVNYRHPDVVAIEAMKEPR